MLGILYIIISNPHNNTLRERTFFVGVFFSSNFINKDGEAQGS